MRDINKKKIVGPGRIHTLRETSLRCSCNCVTPREPQTKRPSLLEYHSHDDLNHHFLCICVQIICEVY